MVGADQGCPNTFKTLALVLSHGPDACRDWADQLRHPEFAGLN